MLKELKKLFSSRLTWVALLLTLAYMIYLSYADWRGMGKPDGNDGRQIVKFVDEIGVSNDYNEINKNLEAYWAKTESLSKESKEYFDAASKLYDSASIARYVYVDFPEHRRNMVTELFYTVQNEKGKKDPDSYVLAYNEKALEYYNKYIPLEFKSTGMSNDRYNLYYTLYNLSYWEVIMIAFIVIVTVRMFTMERTSGAYQLINTSRKNSRRLFFKKYAAVLAVCFLIRAVHFITEILYYVRSAGFTNLYLPIQQFTDFEGCPWQISIAGFIAVKEAAVLLMYGAFAALAALLSVLILNPLVSLIVNLVLLESGFLFYRYAEFKTTDAADKFRTYVPHALMNVKEYFIKFDYCNFFGVPVSRIAFCMAFTAFICIVSLALGFILSGRGKR